MNGDIDVRSLTADEVFSMLPSMQVESWATTKQDLEIMTACSPGAFHGALEKRTQRVVSLILVAPLNSNFAYLSYFLTHRDFRDKGIGRQVYRSAMASIGDRSVTLDAVTSDMVRIYEKWGFHETSTVLDTYHGTINMQILNEVIANEDRKVKVIDQAKDNLTDVIEYDFPTGRRQREMFWQILSEGENITCKCAVNNGKIVGLGVLQPYDAAWWKISMLYADSKQIAALIIRHILLDIPGNQPSFIIGIINKYEGPRKLYQQIGMKYFKREFRMVTKREMDIDYHRIWAYNNTLHEPY